MMLCGVLKPSLPSGTTLSYYIRDINPLDSLDLNLLGLDLPLHHSTHQSKRCSMATATSTQTVQLIERRRVKSLRFYKRGDLRIDHVEPLYVFQEVIKAMRARN